MPNVLEAYMNLNKKSTRAGITRGGFAAALALCFFLLAPSATNADITSGLVGYWTFDGKDTNWTSQIAGTTNDKSGLGNTGTLTNMSQSTTPAAGKIGQGLKFNGTNNSVGTNNTTALDNLFSSGITICFWAKYPNFTTFQRTVTIENNANTDYDVWFQANNATGQMQVGSGGSTGYKNGSTALTANQWYYLCGLTNYTSAGTKIYINGVDDGGTVNATPTYTADKGSFDIGRLNVASVAYYGAGTFDDVRIYNRALSSAEVTQLYKLGQARVGVSPSTSSGQLTQGLVGYWTFDGKDTNWNTNTTADKSGQGNTGTLISMYTTTSPVAGKIGQGLKFDGVSNYISFGTTNIPTTAPLTVSAWIKYPTAIEAVTRWDDSNSAYNFYLYNTDFYVRKSLTNEINHVSWSAPSGGWHLITVTADSSANLIAYIDGVQAGTGSFAGWYATNNAPLTIGARNTYSGPITYSKGTVDDVRIYNRALSAQEITQLYKLGQAKVGVSPIQSLTSGLVGYWTFDGKDTNWTSQIAGTTNDKSGQGNTGTLTNMSQSTTPAAGKIGQGLKFDGVNDYVALPNNVFSSNTVGTVSAWIKTSVDGASVFSMSAVGNDNKLFDILTSGGITLQTYSSGDGFNDYLSGNTSVIDNKWHHIVVESSGGADGWTFYVDGVVQSLSVTVGSNSGRWFSSVNTGNNTFYMGHLNATYSRYFKGSIDDVRIYNRALSASEVTQLYKSGQTTAKSTF